MRELSQIIEELTQLNKQIIEKDNFINKMQGVIDLTSQMLTDAGFVHSEIYLDLRVKYLTQLEDLLKKITVDQTQITIEPENIIPPKSGKSRTYTKDDVTAPIMTDIYQHPGSRKTFIKKKPDPKEKEPAPEYYEFTFNNKLYYMKTTPKEGDEQEIYDEQLSVVGNLKHDKVTIITDSTQMKTETHQLKQITSPEQTEHLFGSYYVRCP